MNIKTWFGIVVAIAVIGGFIVVGQLSSLNAKLSDAQDEAEEAQSEADSANEEVEDLEDELADAEVRISRLRRQQRAAAEALTLQEALDAGIAETESGLSADLSRFTCVNARCNTIEGTVTFSNETQESGPITCLFKVEYENGDQTFYSWYSEWVPAKSTNSGTYYFAFDYPSSASLVYDAEECYRGIATFNPGFSDI